MYKSISIAFFLAIFLIFSFVVDSEEGSWSYSIIDKTGDDYGPGNYLYPQNEIFSPYKGHFDIKEFSIKEKSDNYVFEFDFVTLNDPWKSEFGFSLPLIEIYIDNNEGGTTELLEEGANVKLDSEHPWNKVIKLSGWWVLLYEDNENIDEVVSIASDITESKWQVENSKVKREGNKILMEIPKDKLGEMLNSYIQLLIGSFDPFGPGHFREIDTEPSKWEFHAPSIKNPEIATRVIDTIVPKNYTQEELLSLDNENGPQLKAIKLKKENEGKTVKIIASPLLYLLIIFIFIIIFAYIRKIT
ncbi:MAG: glucodextranase DOMON-like domain-containing protein [Bacillota bacterium]